MVSDEVEVREGIEEKVVRHIVSFQGGQDQDEDLGDTDLSDLSKEELIAKYRQERAKVESIAVKEFRDQKDNFIAAHPKFADQIEEKVNSGPELENFRELIESLEDQDRVKKHPVGKVSLRQPQTKSLRQTEFKDHDEMLRFLVSRRELGEIESRSPKPNQDVIREGREAGQMLEELWSVASESGRRLSAERRLVFEEDPSEVNPAYVKNPKKIKIIR